MKYVRKMYEKTMNFATGFVLTFSALFFSVVSVFADGLLERECVKITVSEQGGAIAIADESAGLTWTQDASESKITASEFKTEGQTLTYVLTVPGQTDRVRASLEILTSGEAELTLEGGKMTASIPYPPCWTLKAEDALALPVGAGVRWPATLEAGENPEYFTLNKTMFWSRGLSMGVWGVLRGESGEDGEVRESWMFNAIREAADASLAVKCVENRLHPVFYWESEGGEWAYARKIRFLFGSKGGLSAACRAYREFRKSDGFVKTLREKQAEYGLAAEKLAGAANVWLWHDDYAELMYGTTTDPIDVENAENIQRIASEMKSAGMDRVLWGIFFQNDAKTVPFLAKLGFLTTKYDNYQDVMPAELQKVIPPHRVACCDFTARRSVNWPQDMRRDAAGNIVNAWQLRGTDGKLYSQNAMCERQAAPYIRKEAGEDAQKYGYTARFIDCMGGHIVQCFDPAHPLTRREARKFTLENFQTLHSLGLLSGTEEGVECYLPGLDYAEGRMSVFLYRILPQMCWRYKSDFYSDESGEKRAYLERYMLSPKYRIPFWALVYHDCSVDYWYWGDASNNVPSAMDRRGLWNVLYGTPPMYSFKTKDWPLLKESILRSYARTTGIVRKTCFMRMLDFRYLTPDLLVQRTSFTDGNQAVSVTVNFSEKDFVQENGESVPPGEFRVLEGFLGAGGDFPK